MSLLVISIGSLHAESLTVVETLPDTGSSINAEVMASFSKGDYKAVKSQLGKLNAIESQSSDVLYLSARVESMLGNHEAGRQVYSKILEKFGTGKGASTAEILIGAKTATLMLDHQGAIELLTLQFQKLDWEIEKSVVDQKKSADFYFQQASLLSVRGEVFLSAHELQHAENDFKRALEICPQFLPALASYCAILFEQGRYGETITVANQLLTLVKDGALSLPQHNMSLLVQIASSESELRMLYLKAMVFLIENDLPAVKEIEKQFSDKGSYHPWYLSLLAGRAYLGGEAQILSDTLKRSKNVAPGSSLPFVTVGVRALMSRQNRDAEKYLKLALKSDMRSAEAYYLLGQLFLRTGRVEEAREHLFRARLCDPAFENSVNYLNVLDYMADRYVYSSFGESVVIKTHIKEHALQNILAPMVGQCMVDLGRKYTYSYREPLVVEVHPDEEHFSLRAVGLPWIPVAGVCFGRVVSLLSPSVGISNINMRSLLSHELSHSYTLGITNGRIPRWLTEGLAQIDSKRIRPEYYGRSFKLFSRLSQLSPLTSLDRPFVRPRVSLEVGSAYYQAWLVTKWLVDNYGMEKMLSLLKKLGTGEVSSSAVFQYFDESGDIDKKIMDHLYSHGRALSLRPLVVDLNTQSLFDRDTVSGSNSSLNFDEEAVSRIHREFSLLKKIHNGQEGLIPAWKELRVLLKASPAPELYALGGEILLVLEKPERAVKYLTKAIKDGDNTAETLLALAKSLTLQHKLNDAAKLLEERLPETYPVKILYDLLVEVYRGLSQRDKPDMEGLWAEKVIAIKEDYCRRRNDESQWSIELYRHFSKKNQRGKARRYLEQAVLVEPFSDQLKDQLEKVVIGESSWGRASLLMWEQSLLSSTERQIQFRKSEGREKLSLALFAVLDGELSSVPWLLKEFSRLKKEGLSNESRFIVFALETVALKSLVGDEESLHKWWKTEIAGNHKSYILGRLGEAGYPIDGLSAIERAGVLVLALDSDDWFVRYRAGRLLDKEAYTVKFRNALWAPNLNEKGYNYSRTSSDVEKKEHVPAYRDLVDDVSFFWKNWLKNKL